jgi:hypothetical protein
VLRRVCRVTEGKGIARRLQESACHAQRTFQQVEDSFAARATGRFVLLPQ